MTNRTPEPPKTPNPFDLLIEQIRVVVREEFELALEKKPPTKLQYTLDEAADRLNVKRSLLIARIKGDPAKGQSPLPHHRMGKRIYFTEQDITLIDQMTAVGGNDGKN
jgi:hypothetical protein